MQLRKLIQRRIRKTGPGTDLAVDLNAVVAANVGERGATTVSSRSETKPARREESDAKEQATEDG
jgi:hypothetical protein